MSTLSLRLPQSIHKSVGELAKQEGISINQFVATAVAEKLSALTTVDYLQSRAKRVTRKAFEQILAKVPSVEPEPADRLPVRELLPVTPQKTRRGSG